MYQDWAFSVRVSPGGLNNLNQVAQSIAASAQSIARLRPEIESTVNALNRLDRTGGVQHTVMQLSHLQAQLTDNFRRLNELETRVSGLTRQMDQQNRRIQAMRTTQVRTSPISSGGAGGMPAAIAVNQSNLKDFWVKSMGVNAAIFNRMADRRRETSAGRMTQPSAGAYTLPTFMANLLRMTVTQPIIQEIRHQTATLVRVLQRTGGDHYSRLPTPVVPPSPILQSGARSAAAGQQRTFVSTGERAGGAPPPKTNLQQLLASRGFTPSVMQQLRADPKRFISGSLSGLRIAGPIDTAKLKQLLAAEIGTHKASRQALMVDALQQAFATRGSIGNVITQSAHGENPQQILKQLASRLAGSKRSIGQFPVRIATGLTKLPGSGGLNYALEQYEKHLAELAYPPTGNRINRRSGLRSIHRVFGTGGGSAGEFITAAATEQARTEGLAGSGRGKGQRRSTAWKPDDLDVAIYSKMQRLVDQGMVDPHRPDQFNRKLRRVVGSVAEKRLGSSLSGFTPEQIEEKLRKSWRPMAKRMGIQSEDLEAWEQAGGPPKEFYEGVKRKAQIEKKQYEKIVESTKYGGANSPLFRNYAGNLRNIIVSGQSGAGGASGGDIRPLIAKLEGTNIILREIRNEIRMLRGTQLAGGGTAPSDQPEGARPGVVIPGTTTTEETKETPKKRGRPRKESVTEPAPAGTEAVEQRWLLIRQADFNARPSLADLQSGKIPNQVHDTIESAMKARATPEGKGFIAVPLNQLIKGSSASAGTVLTNTLNQPSQFTNQRTPGAMGDRRSGLGVRWLDAATRAGLYGSAAGVLYGGFAGLRSSVSFMADWDEQLIKIERVMNPLGADMKQISAAAKEMGITYGVGIREVAEGMQIFAQQGKTVSEIMELTRVSVLATNVTELELVQATEALTAATQQFHRPASEAINILDAWNEVENTTAVNATVLVKALMASGTAAHQAGVGFHEFNGMVAAVGEATRKGGEQIGTSMKFILQHMRDTKAVEALQEVGIYTTDMSGRMMSARNVMASLKERWDTLTEAQQHNVAVSIAGTRHLNDFYVLMNRWERAMDISSVSLLSQGSAMAENEKTMRALNKQVAQLKAEWQSFLGTMAETGAIDVLSSLIKGVTELVRLMSRLDAKAGNVTGGPFGAAMAGGLAATGVGMYALWPNIMDTMYGRQMQPSTAGRLPGGRPVRGASSTVMPDNLVIREGGTDYVDPRWTDAGKGGKGGTVLAGYTPRGRRGNYMRRYGGGSALVIGGIMGHEAAASMDDSNAAKPWVQAGGSVMTAGGFATMAGRGKLGWAIKGLSALYAAGSVYSAFSKPTGGDQDKAKIDALANLQERMDNAFSSVKQTLADLESGKDVDPTVMAEIVDRLKSLSPAFDDLTVDSANLMDVLKKGGTELARARQELRSSAADYAAKKITAATGNPEFQQLLKQRQDIYASMRGEKDPGKAAAAYEQLRDISLKLQPFWSAYQAMANNLGAAGGGAARLADEQLVTSVMQATGASRDQVFAKGLKELIRGKTGYEFESRALLDGADPERALRQGFIKFAEKGPIFRLWDMSELARSRDDVEGMSAELRASGAILIDASRQLAGVPVLKPESLRELTTNFVQAVNAIGRRNEELLASSAWINKTNAIAGGVAAGGGVLTGENLRAILRDLRVNQDIESRGIHTIGQPAGDMSAPGAINRRFREASGHLLQASTNPHGASLQGVLGIGMEMQTMVPMARREASKYIRQFIELSSRENMTEDQRETLNTARTQVEQYAGDAFSEINYLVTEATQAMRSGNTAGYTSNARAAEALFLDQLGADFRNAVNREGEFTRARLDQMLVGFTDSVQQLGLTFGSRMELGQTGGIDDFLNSPEVRQILDGLTGQRDVVAQQLSSAEAHRKRLTQSGADDEQLKHAATRVETLQSALTAMNQTLTESSKRIWSVDYGMKQLEQRLQLVQTAASSGGSYGLTGLNAVNEQIRVLSSARSSIQRDPRYDNQTVAKAVEQLTDEIRSARTAQAGMLLQRTINRTGATQSATISNILTRMGLPGGAGASAYLADQEQIVTEQVQALVQRAMPSLRSSRDVQKFTDLVVAKLGPLMGRLAEAGVSEDANYRKAFLLASPSEQVAASQIQGMIGSGMSAEDIFADPMMRDLARDNPLIGMLLDRAISADMANPARVLKLQEEMTAAMTRLPGAIEELIAALGQFGSGFPAPKLESGSLAVAPGPAVDATGRIRRDGTPAILHQGEIVLNREQSNSLMRNKFADGTLRNDIEPYLRNPKLLEWINKTIGSGAFTKPFSAGEMGVSFPWNARAVVKFGTDEREALAHLFLAEHLGNKPYFAQSYGVKSFNSYVSGELGGRGAYKDVFVMMMERLSDAPLRAGGKYAGADIMAAADIVSDYSLNSRSGLLGEVGPRAYGESQIRQIADYRANKGKFIHSKLPQTKELALGIFNSWWNLEQDTQGQLRPVDTHGGNILFKGNTPAFFDWGLTRFSDDANVSSDFARLSIGRDGSLAHNRRTAPPPSAARTAPSPVTVPPVPSHVARRARLEEQLLLKALQARRGNSSQISPATVARIAEWTRPFVHTLVEPDIIPESPDGNRALRDVTDLWDKSIGAKHLSVQASGLRNTTHFAYIPTKSEGYLGSYTRGDVTETGPFVERIRKGYLDFPRRHHTGKVLTHEMQHLLNMEAPYQFPWREFVFEDLMRDDPFATKVATSLVLSSDNESYRRFAKPLLAKGYLSPASFDVGFNHEFALADEIFAYYSEQKATLGQEPHPTMKGVNQVRGQFVMAMDHLFDRASKRTGMAKVPVRQLVRVLDGYAAMLSGVIGRRQENNTPWQLDKMFQGNPSTTLPAPTDIDYGHAKRILKHAKFKVKKNPNGGYDVFSPKGDLITASEPTRRLAVQNAYGRYGVMRGASGTAELSNSAAGMMGQHAEYMRVLQDDSIVAAARQAYTRSSTNPMAAMRMTRGLQLGLPSAQYLNFGAGFEPDTGLVFGPGEYNKYPYRISTAAHLADEAFQSHGIIERTGIGGREFVRYRAGGEPSISLNMVPARTHGITQLDYLGGVLGEEARHITDINMLEEVPRELWTQKSNPTMHKMRAQAARNLMAYLLNMETSRGLGIARFDPVMRSVIKMMSEHPGYGGPIDYAQKTPNAFFSGAGEHRPFQMMSELIAKYQRTMLARGFQTEPHFRMIDSALNEAVEIDQLLDSGRSGRAATPAEIESRLYKVYGSISRATKKAGITPDQATPQAISARLRHIRLGTELGLRGRIRLGMRRFGGRPGSIAGITDLTFSEANYGRQTQTQIAALKRLRPEARNQIIAQLLRQPNSLLGPKMLMESGLLNPESYAQFEIDRLRRIPRGRARRMAIQKALDRSFGLGPDTLIAEGLLTPNEAQRYGATGYRRPSGSLTPGFQSDVGGTLAARGRFQLQYEGPVSLSAKPMGPRVPTLDEARRFAAVEPAALGETEATAGKRGWFRRPSMPGMGRMGAFGNWLKGNLIGAGIAYALTTAGGMAARHIGGETGGQFWEEEAMPFIGHGFTTMLAANLAKGRGVLTQLPLRKTIGSALAMRTGGGRLARWGGRLHNANWMSNWYRGGGKFGLTVGEATGGRLGGFLGSKMIGGVGGAVSFASTVELIGMAPDLVMKGLIAGGMADENSLANDYTSMLSGATGWGTMALGAAKGSLWSDVRQQTDPGFEASKQVLAALRDEGQLKFMGAVAGETLSAVKGNDVAFVRIAKEAAAQNARAEWMTGVANLMGARVLQLAPADAMQQAGYIDGTPAQALASGRGRLEAHRKAIKARLDHLLGTPSKLMGDLLAIQGPDGRPLPQYLQLNNQLYDQIAALQDMDSWINNQIVAAQNAEQHGGDSSKMLDIADMVLTLRQDPRKYQNYMSLAAGHSLDLLIDAMSLHGKGLRQHLGPNYDAFRQQWVATNLSLDGTQSIMDVMRLLAGGDFSPNGDMQDYWAAAARGEDTVPKFLQRAMGNAELVRMKLGSGPSMFDRAFSDITTGMAEAVAQMQIQKNKLANAPGMAVGSMALANTSSVDPRGRIRHDETLARLHRGEIVLNNKQADEYERNAFEDGTYVGPSLTRAYRNQGAEMNVALSSLQSTLDTFAAGMQQFMSNIAEASINHEHTGVIRLESDDALASLVAEKVAELLQAQTGAPVKGDVVRDRHRFD